MKTDYSRYVFSGREKAVLLLQMLGIAVLVNVLFYQSLYSYILLIPFSFLWLPYCHKRKCRARRRKLNYQFKDALVSLGVALRAGYSLENAVQETASDLEQIYGAKADVTKEFSIIANGIRINLSLEAMLADLGQRSQLEDIEYFASVLITARKMGGDMAGILMKSARILEEKIDVKKEVDSMIAGKQMEQKIMSAMPLVMILYMRWTSPGFLDCLYGNWLGAGVMTGCLMVYLAAWYMAERIMEIEV